MPRFLPVHPGVCLLALGVAFTVTLGCKSVHDEETKGSASTTSASPAVSAAVARPRKKVADLSPPPLKPPATAQVGPAGSRWELLKAGSGGSVPENGVLETELSVWRPDGTLAFSTYSYPVPQAISPSALPEEFGALLVKLKAGSSARFWLPLAAHQSWTPKTWPKTDLVVEMEVVSVKASRQKVQLLGRVPPNTTMGQATVPAPDAAGAPPTASRSKAGFPYVLIARGQSPARAKPDQRVEIVVDAWSLKGLLPSKVVSQRATVTTLERAPAAIADIIGGLGPGDRARVWLPKARAKEILPEVNGKHDVVLDVTLRKIE